MIRGETWLAEDKRICHGTNHRWRCITDIVGSRRRKEESWALIQAKRDEKWKAYEHKHFLMSRDISYISFHKI